MQVLYIYADFEDVCAFCLISFPTFFISSVTWKQKPKKPRICFLSLRLRLASSQRLTRASSRQAPAEGKAVTLRATQKTNTVINIKNIISRRLGLLVQRFRIYLLKGLRFNCAKV